jgi:hypothetical protein
LTSCCADRRYPASPLLRESPHGRRGLVARAFPRGGVTGASTVGVGSGL